MEVKVQVVRIYGSDSAFINGPTPMPIPLENFPRAGERAGVLVGAIPSHVEQALKLAKARGSLQLEWMFRRTGDQDEPHKNDSLIEERLNDPNLVLFNSPYRWNTTIWVESTVELDDEQESSSRYIWLDDKTARSQENMLKEKAAASLDVLAAYLVSVITRQFFTELVLEDRTIFLKNNHYPLSVPRFVTRGGTVKAYAERQYSEIADLGEFLSRVAALPAQRHDWLKPIARSYFELLGEEDQWKQFLWSFLTLEMLTSKLWENFYKKIKTNLGLLSLASNDGKVEPEIQEAIPYLLTPDDPNRVPLMKKFAIVALSLTPSTAATDIAAFKRLKEVRDNLAHGVLTNEHQLPVSESRILLDRYVRLAVSAKLDDVN